MTETPRKPRVEIFVDGTNFRVAQLDMGVGEIDLPRLARQLATDMVAGAHADRYDVAMRVAWDTDYVHAIEAVQAMRRKVVWCHFPAQGHTDRLRQVADEQIVLSEKFLRTCR